MNMVDLENSCNVCGMTFKWAWGPMMWGNFWSARCDYVKNLVSASLLQEKNTLAFEQRPQQMTTDLFSVQAKEYSLPIDSHFAAEIFVGTHPARALPYTSIPLDRGPKLLSPTHQLGKASFTIHCLVEQGKSSSVSK
jgi:hypothetical protein